MTENAHSHFTGLPGFDGGPHSHQRKVIESKS